MNATVLELRTKMRQVLRALDRQEPVTLTYRGKVKGVIMPAGPEPIRVEQHPFFGSAKGPHKRTVEKELRQLRAGRYRAL